MSKTPAIAKGEIENRIFELRGVQVMLDYHLAELYKVETKRLNEQVKRNKKRFPETFMFQMAQKEWEVLQEQIAATTRSNELRSQTATAKRRTLPYAFTEQGVAMLSGVLNSEVAISISIQIMNAFVEMRKLIGDQKSLLQRIEGVEQKQIQAEQNFERIFEAIENKELIPNQGVFFDGQVFDAYHLASKIIRSATKNSVLIDNYIDENTLTHLSKKKKGVKVILCCKRIKNSSNWT